MFRKLSSVKARDIKDAFSLSAITFRAGISTAKQTYSGNAGSYPQRIFAPFAIYKGKAALSVSPVLPTFAKLSSGDLRLDRRGSMMLTFSPAISERKYDWEKKQLFALSATEIGSLISLGSTDSCEFFHDPSMQTSNAGQVRKSLSIKAHQDGNGYFISLNVVNNLLKTTDRLSLPVTTAEFAVMRTAFSFALPQLMGWDRLTNQLPGSSSSTMENSSSTSARQLLDTEWDK